MAESYPIAQLLSEVQQKRSDAGLNPGPYNNLFGLVETETIAAALRKLHAHKILSAPVEFQGRNRGIVDLADICAAIANAPALNIDTKTLMNMPLKDLFGKVMGMPVRDAVTISVKLPVLEAITALSVNHRVLVTDPDDYDKPVGLLSQMDVLRFVVRHWDQVPRGVRDERAERLMTKNPHTVAQKDRVAEALKMFGKENVSGVGVVDEQGKLVANFSIADLRSAVAEALPELLKESVVGFLHKTKGHAAHGDLLTKDLILADPDTTLEEAAKQMLAHHVHRLYVLDGKGKPVGVLSTTDVCAFLAKALGKKGSPK